jgi:FkbM family methyltransferase
VPNPFPNKQITLDSYKFQLHGISISDQYWNGVGDNFEPEFQRFSRQIIQPDYVCLDIGANIGVKTLFLSRHCSHGQVIAVEAGKSVAACLATNIAANGCSNAISLHAAVADHDGPVFFNEYSAWGHQSATGCKVEALTLETLVSRYNLTRLDFIKIDVEGGEFPILKSSLALINRFDTLLLVELNALTMLVWGNTNPREFLEWIGVNFSHVYALNRRDPAGSLLTPVTTSDGCRAILHRHLVDDGCVTDLVMSNAARRFDPSPVFLEQQIQRHIAEVTQLRADLARAQVEIVKLSRVQATASQVEAERDALLKSTSWRLTAPLRWVKRRRGRGVMIEQ